MDTPFPHPDSDNPMRPPPVLARVEGRGRSPRYGSPGADSRWSARASADADDGPDPVDGPLSPHGQLVDYLKVLHKRRWTAITAFVVVLGSVTLYTFLATPLYRASVQILLENEKANVVKFDEVIEQNREATDYYQTQYRMLQSRALARRTIETLGLWNHVLLAPHGEQGSTPWRIASGAAGWVQNKFSGGQVPADEAPGADETAAQSAAIDAYLRRLRVAPIRNSRLVDVAILSPDARFSAKVANTHAQQFIDQNLEHRFVTSKEASNWLGQQLEAQRKQVEASEQALQRYRESSNSISLEDRQNIVVQRLAELNAAVTRARTERIQREAAYQQLRGIQSNRAALDTFPAILANGFIQQLKGELANLQRQEAQLNEKLGDKHPEMVKVRSAISSTDARLAAEVQTVVQAVRNEYETAMTQERTLSAALEQQKQEAMGLNRTAIDYGALQREAESNRQIFQGLLQRTRETGITTDLKTNNVRIVDRAEIPRNPASPRRAINLLGGLAGGLVLALGLTFLLESLDSRVKSPEEIKSELGIPFLGLVPSVPSAGPDGPVLAGPDWTSTVPHGFAEAIRGVRTNVLFSVPDPGCKSIVITSTGPREGKTTIAAGLGLALAQAGHRVLIIDCDMRRPRIHEVVDMPQEPGLSHVLVGEVRADAAMRQVPGHSAWVLPAGKLPPNPAELLGSARFTQFMDALSDGFDWILLDSPPVMAVTDASILAHRATGVIFVIGAEMTNRGAARTALEQLDAARGHHLGAVLNKVNLRKNSYYYAHYYHRDYESYYGRPEPKAKTG